MSPVVLGDSDDVHVLGAVTSETPCLVLPKLEGPVRVAEAEAD